MLFSKACKPIASIGSNSSAWRGVAWRGNATHNSISREALDASTLKLAGEAVRMHMKCVSSTVERGAKCVVTENAQSHARARFSRKGESAATRRFALVQVSSEYTQHPSLPASLHPSLRPLPRPVPPPPFCSTGLARWLSNGLNGFCGSTSRERIIHRRGSYGGNIGKFAASSGFYPVSGTAIRVQQLERRFLASLRLQMKSARRNTRPTVTKRKSGT